MSRRLPTLLAVLAGGVASALAACNDDDATSTGPTTDAGTESSVTVDGPPAASALPSYIVPGTEAMAAITIHRATGALYVDSAESGKIYRGAAGADQETTLELLADLTSAGLSRGGHLAISADGATLYVLSGFGDTPRVNIVDIATKTLTKSLAIPGTGASPINAIQDVAVSPDGKTLYATSSFENVIHTVDLSSFATSTFPISSAFPFIADPGQGFINATGLSISNDGKYLLVVHIIDKHIYRVSLDPSSLGDARRIDTGPYNVSGNGLWLGADEEALEVAGDELRIFRFKMNADYTNGDFQAKYQGDAIEQGVSYAVAHRDRILVLNGSGVSLAAGGLPGGAFPEAGPGDGGAEGGGGFPFPEGGGFPQPGTDAGAKKLPIKVLQLPK